jgi:hypothetical protein
LEFDIGRVGHTPFAKIIQWRLLQCDWSFPRGEKNQCSNPCEGLQVEGDGVYAL